MRDSALDEFGSLFERASIPVFDIPEESLSKIGIVLTGGVADTSVAKLGAFLEERFSASISLYCGSGCSGSSFVSKETGWEAVGYSTTAALVEGLECSQSQLVLFSEVSSEGKGGGELDELVEALAAPVLIVREPLNDPGKVFEHVLHNLTGSLKQIRNLAYSFSLVADEGELMLLHVIAAEELEDVRDTLLVSSEISREEGANLIHHLKDHTERYLKGIVASSRTEPYEVSYRLSIGDVLPCVEEELRRGDFGLLVVGTHAEGRSHTDAVEYQLMHAIQDTPVLAL